tara:strand:- start:1237 stop:2157 length:921 start_codon:yes stop_codon:yes gene_type:complete
MKTTSGFLILNKDKGCTSHDCVKRIRNLYNIRKVGHAGTLDPQVTGVLPIAIGSATKFIQYLPKEKTYIGTIQLGIRTNTDDIHGEIIQRKEWPTITKKQLEEHLNLYRGTFDQIPPKVSSVHIQGERAYKKSLRNENFQIPSKSVHISELVLKKWDQTNGKIELLIKCSAGTYIRSLARDLGSTIKSEGCLYSLKRVESCGFTEKNSISINELKNTNLDKNDHIIPIINAMSHMPKYLLKSEEEYHFWETGRRIKIGMQEILLNKEIKDQNIFIVVDINNELLGIGIVIKDKEYHLQPKLVLNAK